MSKNARVIINGKTIRASLGQTIVEAGLQHGVLVPHDCCSGQCDTCRISVLSGAVDDAGTREGDTVLGCQARVSGDAELHFDTVPLVIKTGGVVVSVQDLSGEIVEVIVRTTKAVPYLPGQYVKMAFAGYPSRDYSPSLTLDGLRDLDTLVFHIRRLDDGIVSSALGSAIKPGRKISLQGPYGHAFLRQGEGRIVLVSSGTGFAPIWSIAVAARLGQPHRPIALVAAARDPRNLYMRPALGWLTKHGVGDLVMTASGAIPLPPARFGRPTAHLPALSASDTVYAAGSTEMVAAVKALAHEAGAQCYADPFLPSGGDLPLRLRIARLFTRKKKPPSRPPGHSSTPPSDPDTVIAAE